MVYLTLIVKLLQNIPGRPCKAGKEGFPSGLDEGNPRRGLVLPYEGKRSKLRHFVAIHRRGSSRDVANRCVERTQTTGRSVRIRFARSDP